MPDNDLWKYCTAEHCKELLLSFRLFGNTAWSGEKQIACLYGLSRHIGKHYARAVIPKRDGSARHLLVPDPLLKQVQKNILHHVLAEMPVSPHATAYHPKANVFANARPHLRQPQVLRLDIEDFFGTITFPMVYNQAFPYVYFPPSVRTLLTHLCCYRDYLPQGAPTSAAISNLVLKPFDDHMGRWCSERGITYTRYCDDMVFSGDLDAHAVKNKVQNFLQAMGFSLNLKKTRLSTRHQQQVVTGLVVNEKVQAPVQYRKALRKEIYFCQKYGVQSHLTQTADQTYLPHGHDGVVRYLASLLGKVNFVLQANPQDAYFQQAKSAIQHMRAQFLTHTGTLSTL